MKPSEVFRREKERCGREARYYKQVELWAYILLLLILLVDIARAETIQLQCTASPSADLQTHTLYQSKRSDFIGAVTKDIGKGCEAAVTVDGAGGDYFKATAKDTSGNESGPSNVLFVADTVAPASPSELKKK